jgi:nicotinate-nucleotide pyrophosphorylase (carboxylating)
MKFVLDLNALTLPDLFDALVSDKSLVQLIRAARDEDLGSAGDITSASVIEPAQRGRAVLAARRRGVVCGQHHAGPIISAFDADLMVEWRTFDGDCCDAGGVIAILEGCLRDLLAIERTLLNFVARLSGIATLSSRYVNAVAGARAVICDTRKTTPGWRGLEKYAVRCGGGTLHRVGLFDAALYKDNHLAAIGGDDLPRALSRAIASVRTSHPVRFVEVEVDSLARLEQVLSIKPGLIDIVLLDNMEPEDIRRAVAIRGHSGAPVQLEASGGVTLDNVRAIAETGVDRISVGAMTHSAPALDVGLDLEAGRPDAR